MKVSVSLPDEDVRFLDAYARDRGLASRSAVLHKAVRLLSALELGNAYDAAWQEWTAAGEAEAWDGVVQDGIST